MSRTKRRRRPEDVLYGMAISGLAIRYGFGRMMPDEPGLDEFATIELSGGMQHPVELRGRPAILKLRHESFIVDLDDVERVGASIGHIDVEEDEVRGDILIPFRSAASMLVLAASGRLRSIVLRGTDLSDGKAEVLQVALDTVPCSGEPQIEER